MIRAHRTGSALMASTISCSRVFWEFKSCHSRRTMGFKGGRSRSLSLSRLIMGIRLCRKKVVARGLGVSVFVRASTVIRPRAMG